ncbi:MAG: formyltetrahydrofolate deformylase [Actinomycetota bacterium]
MNEFILTLKCPDVRGIVASFATGLLELDANIIANKQFTDHETSTFVMRTVFEDDLEDPAQVAAHLAARVEEFDAEISVRRAEDHPRVMILVSKYDHCLVDLLNRHHSGELAADIPLVVSNHDDLRSVVEREGIEFHHIPYSPSTAEVADDALLELIDDHEIDLVVLARYMQILSPRVCERLAGRAINIHHSFLPGFKGARPYHQAWDRGVKLIGATAHYVTEDLDEGPIITQDVTPVSHGDTPASMVIAGRDIERLVLSKAVRAHVEDRVFLIGHRTVVFS